MTALTPKSCPDCGAPLEVFMEETTKPFDVEKPTRIDRIYRCAVDSTHTAIPWTIRV